MNMSKFFTHASLGQLGMRSIFTSPALRRKSPKSEDSAKRNPRSKSNPNYFRKRKISLENLKIQNILASSTVSAAPSPEEIRLEIQRRQEQKPFGLPILSREDCLKRTKFATEFLQLLETEPKFLDSVFFSDEGNFWPMTIKGSSSKSRGRKSRLYAESDQLPTIVWAAMNTSQVIGPYFFNSFVTDRSYTKMIDKYFLKQLKKNGHHAENVWFQQDGAPPHRSKLSLDFLQKSFGSRLISFGAKPPAIAWPPRSQDLTPLDYFLWDYLQTRMTSYHPMTHDNLRECLATEMQCIDPSLLKSETEDLKTRLVKCLNANGERF